MFNQSLRKKRLKIGDEIIIPSLCWSTSLWPIVQSGLKPIFVDIDKETLNINLADLEKKNYKKNKRYNASTCTWKFDGYDKINENKKKI